MGIIYTQNLGKWKMSIICRNTHLMTTHALRHPRDRFPALARILLGIEAQKDCLVSIFVVDKAVIHSGKV